MPDTACTRPGKEVLAAALKQLTSKIWTVPTALVPDRVVSFPPKKGTRRLCPHAFVALGERGLTCAATTQPAYQVRNCSLPALRLRDPIQDESATPKHRLPSELFAQLRIQNRKVRDGRQQGGGTRVRIA